MGIIITSLILGVCSSTLQARPSNLSRRISSNVKDLGKVQPIYMVAGMATLIGVPGPVTGIRTGSPDDIQYFKLEKPENEVTIVLKDASNRPTNLIIRSGKQKYVFDIIPSKSVPSPLRIKS